ncbi:thioredoxin [Merdibacter massiliensis]|uniref:thioredoxin n=1 Tax=Merdibacter massiliensis TaxID=1871030 RepID=UPI00096A6A98|nr:thioredoxin [Merdibacter massiliensis]
MKIINEAEFNQITKEKPFVLVDFFATWCGPCKMLSPVLEELAEEFGSQIEIVKVDVDQQSSLAAQYKIMSVPTMMLFKNGELIQKISGYQPKPQLASFLKQFM